MSRVNATIQNQLSLHNIAGEERIRRNVDELATDSRDPEKIVEGSQTSLSKLIYEKYGLKTFKISFYKNIIFIVYKIKSFRNRIQNHLNKTTESFNSQHISKYFYENC